MHNKKKSQDKPTKEEVEERKQAKERKRKLRELAEHDQELGLYDDYMPNRR